VRKITRFSCAWGNDETLFTEGTESRKIRKEIKKRRGVWGDLVFFKIGPPGTTGEDLREKKRRMTIYIGGVSGPGMFFKRYTGRRKNFFWGKVGKSSCRRRYTFYTTGPCENGGLPR